jgi:transcriptional regulator with XRE-family HTH domain
MIYRLVVASTVLLHNVDMFSRRFATQVNGNGMTAVEWSDALTLLTMRTDFLNLTLQPWTKGSVPYGLLRTFPAWCPQCYQEWREEGQRIYQPLVWMLQCVTICVLHQKQLEQNCPHCHKAQSLFGTKTRQGFCTQCATWLGAPLDLTMKVDEATLHWQLWVVNTIEELRQAASDEVLTWDGFSVGLTACVRTVGVATHLAYLTGITTNTLSKWQNLEEVPTLNKLLEFCYVLGVSPLQLMTHDAVDVKIAVQIRPEYKRPKPLNARSVPFRPVDRERTLELIQAVLDGREMPLAATQIERRLGLRKGALARRFPQEAALVTVLYRTHRAQRAKERREQILEEVRQAAYLLHSQGVTPSQGRVSAMLDNSHIMLIPEVRAALRAVREELEFEQ